jgi:hypothetical protein
MISLRELSAGDRLKTESIINNESEYNYVKNQNNPLAIYVPMPDNERA